MTNDIMQEELNNSIVQTVAENTDITFAKVFVKACSSTMILPAREQMEQCRKIYNLLTGESSPTTPTLI